MYGIDLAVAGIGALEGAAGYGLRGANVLREVRAITFPGEAVPLVEMIFSSPLKNQALNAWPLPENYTWKGTSNVSTVSLPAHKPSTGASPGVAAQATATRKIRAIANNLFDITLLPLAQHAAFKLGESLFQIFLETSLFAGPQIVLAIRAFPIREAGGDGRPVNSLGPITGSGGE